MENLYYKVKLYLEANSKTESEFDSNIVLQDDGSGGYIKTWSVSGLNKPTDEQLNSFSANATKENNNNGIRRNRRNLYGNIGDQLDEIFKDIDAWKTRIQKIKDDNPKE